MHPWIDKLASLTPAATRVIVGKATEYPHSGNDVARTNPGTYLCRRCGIALFRGQSRFASGCGWPAFDTSVADHVREVPDADGKRMEIVCTRCDAHLGHVFRGEHFTSENTRYCVNAISLDFVDDTAVQDTGEVIVAGGCFWGVEYWLRQLEGVLAAESGYCGGHLENPAYEAVCRGNTGHLEAVRILYDRKKTANEPVLRRFFEIHDPTQAGGQGPDIGQQYQSAIFCYDEDQRRTAESLLTQLQSRGYETVTQVLPVMPFWPAEAYHQRYYEKHPKLPYCHRPVQRFS